MCAYHLYLYICPYKHVMYMYIHVGYIMSIDCVSLSFPTLWQFLKLPLFWWPWVLRNTGHVFCRMSISSVCLILDRLWISRGKTTEVKCHSHHIVSRVHVINMTYYWWCSPWPEVDFVSFLCIKVTLSLLFYILYFLEGSWYAKPTFKWGS